jgi:hypothetical protein
MVRQTPPGSGGPNSSRQVMREPGRPAISDVGRDLSGDLGEPGLEPHCFDELSSWAFGDFVFSRDYDMFADGSKARRYGFHEYVDTEAMFPGTFAGLRRRKIIP